MMDAIHYEKYSVSGKFPKEFISSSERYITKPSKGTEWSNLYDVPFPSQTRNVIQKSIIYESRNKNEEDTKCNECRTPEEPFCHVKLDSILKLKDSTKKLLYLLDEIQYKTNSKSQIRNEPHVNGPITAVPSTDNTQSVLIDVIGIKDTKRLEEEVKNLGGIYIEDDEDDCSVYKRLVRQCHCLNRREYNDLIIHFNEDTRYITSTNGEIIKNMKILKKFLYMGGGYAKNALVFLNEGLFNSTCTEKVEIINGISHADVCNVFEDYSIVTVHISWPCKYENSEHPVSKSLAAGLLYKLAQSEEGRRYLKFSSKITDDIKRVLRKKASKLDSGTLESLNATLNLINPPLTQKVNVTYYCKPINEGFGNKITQALIQYRQYMTLDTVLTHLDLLHNTSDCDHGIIELTTFLPSLLNLFKHMLMEYDDSEVNIVITNILNNVVAKNIMNEDEEESTKIVNTVAETESPSLLSKSKKSTKDNRKSIIAMMPIEE